MADIPIASAEQTSAQTNSDQNNKTTLVTITASALSTAGIVAGDKCHILAQAQGGTDANNTHWEMECAEDGTVIPHTLHLQESADAGATDMELYMVSTVHTLSNPLTDIIVRFRRTFSFGNAQADNITLSVMSLAGLTEDTDYFHDTDINDTQHTTSMVDFATKTFTPATTEDFFVYGFSNISVNDAAIQYEMELHIDNDHDPAISEEGEDTAETICTVLVKGVNLNNTSHTLAVATRDDATGSNNHLYSEILIIRAAVFAEHGFIDTIAEKTLASADTYETIDTQTVTVTTEGLVTFIATAALDAAEVARKGATRMTLDSTVFPVGSDGNYKNVAKDNDSASALGDFGIVTVGTGGKTVDLDAKASNTAALVEHRNLMWHTHALASVAAARRIIVVS